MTDMKMRDRAEITLERGWLSKEIEYVKAWRKAVDQATRALQPPRDEGKREGGDG